MKKVLLYAAATTAAEDHGFICDEPTPDRPIRNPEARNHFKTYAQATQQADAIDILLDLPAHHGDKELKTQQTRLRNIAAQSYSLYRQAVC